MAAIDGKAEEKRVSLYEDDPFDADSHYLCGIRSYRPKWLRRFSNKNLFVLFFAIMEIGQAVFYSYFRSVITTLEKQFSVQTQTIALVMAGKEVSQILCGFVLAYYGSQGNRPRWIASGMLIVSISCLITVSPIILVLGHADLVDASGNAHTSQSLCSHASGSTSFNTSSVVDIGVTAGDPCDPRLSSLSLLALSLIFFGKFVAGAGITMLVTLTLPYLDDSMTKSASALYIAIITGLRVIGPTIGSMLGGLCLSFYVTLTDNPGISPDDPRWIGAWWLGYLVIAAFFAVSSAIAIWFPRFPSRDRKVMRYVDAKSTHVQDISNNNKKKVPKIKGLPSALKRLLRNKILMINAASRCFMLFGNNGFDTFQPKYLESHFQQTASGASFFSGLSGNSMRIVGIIAMGIIFRFWKPKAIYINAWNIFLDLLFVSSLLILMTLSCPNLSIVGHNNSLRDSNPLTDVSTCGSNCSCVDAKFSPVCLNGKNYFSPCHAGCTAYSRTAGKKTSFHNCSCATGSESEWTIVDVVPLSNQNFTLETAAAVKYDAKPQTDPVVAISGFCSYFCSSFTLYLIIVGIQKTFMATRKVGRMLIILRCIDEQDKSLALAITTIMESAFAYIPCPLIYGFLLDAGCIMWGNKCGSRGHCWLYDADYLRYMMHSLTAFFIVGATVLDCILLYLCRSLSFFDDDEEEEEEKKKKMKASNDNLKSNLKVATKDLNMIGAKESDKKVVGQQETNNSNWSRL